VYPVSPAVSTQGVASNQPAMTAEENEAYMRKLNELQKYIPIMGDWINRLNDTKSEQYTKLKSLHNLLQNPNKRSALAGGCVHMQEVKRLACEVTNCLPGTQWGGRGESVISDLFKKLLKQITYSEVVSYYSTCLLCELS